MCMLRAQEDINTLPHPYIVVKSQMAHAVIWGVRLCVGLRHRQAWRHALFFVRNNVMILDAITVSFFAQDFESETCYK